MRYLLDTNICIYIANRKPGLALERLRELQPGDVGMSVVTYCELAYGASKSRQRQANLTRIERLRALIPVQPFTAAAAKAYGELRVGLERRGTPIGAYDMLIAAHAISLGLTLVTNNEREFSRVRGLTIENWAA